MEYLKLPEMVSDGGWDHRPTLLRNEHGALAEHFVTILALRDVRFRGHAVLPL